ncbi:uncharacterized protein EAF01_009706 [Botrytis porri]|uniref:Uncharacterized protein n=1 Tax=Botrytis porri TaxID=87229 RepID=A0A4Z1KHS3_9HELO|nr:uncharacterized protein EAF01_009706 [Botrytis porri]KAF7895744.1 hypothetical protein EAF01_009706 [Botrytis porri]TGO85070.1 hypothetical protein BPOR_0434g00010 [Botrytis porri]
MFYFDIDTLYLDGGPITRYLQVKMNFIQKKHVDTLIISGTFRYTPSLAIYDDLTLIDLQNTASSLVIYGSPYETMAEKALQRKQKSFRIRYCSHNTKLGPSLANIQILDTARLQEAAAIGGVALFEMPIFEYKPMGFA